MRKGLTRGDKLVVSGIPCEVGGINTDGQSKDFLARHTYVQTTGLNQNGWIPDLFVQTADKPESIRALLDRARVLQDTARARLKPFVEAISDYLTHGPERVLGLHWLGEGYSIKCYRGTGAGISLAYEPIHTWEEEDAIHFYVHIEYTNDEHDWEHSLSRNVEVRAPLSLAENFTKKAFAAWVKAKEDELNAKAIQKAKEALDKAKKLKRA